LHIHAASYFETTEQWPEAIHHYLRAGLQRQAARLIAKYGEEVVSEGRLGLVDEWLQQLPPDTIKQNARLSLLFGETCGMRGDWERAQEALQRSREYFARKGDKRFEALACLKLSSVLSNYGSVERSAEVAEAGVELVPPDAIGTRLRLEGNLAITRTWLAGSLEDVVRECQRVAVEAASRGLEHFAAIGYHNAGEAQLRMGEIARALSNLEKAARFWSETPTNPFADNEVLSLALVVHGHLDRAEAVARDAVRRTSPWPRPRSHALYALSGVLLSQGRVTESIDALREATSNRMVLGAAHRLFLSRLIESLFLAGSPATEVHQIRQDIDSGSPADPRYSADVAPALAIADHSSRACAGECQRHRSVLIKAAESGAKFTSIAGLVKIGALSFDHREIRLKRQAWRTLADAVHLGFVAPIRLWVRRYAPHGRVALARPDGASLISRLMDIDPDGWRSEVIQLLAAADGTSRATLLRSVARHANRETVVALQQIQGDDVAELRRQLQHAQASRLYLRTLGGTSLHRGSWTGPVVSIEKRRVRSLLAVLGAHAHMTLTRDMAIDILWPEADGDSAVNNLNQTVFQLRRYLDPAYRQGESPEYVISSSEQVGLSDDLVHTDLQEIRRLQDRIASASWQQRQNAAAKVIGLVAGEFLADLRYETWVTRLQVGVHNEIRARLLPIALQADASFNVQIATDAAAALTLIDPFDEVATLALAECLSRSGRRVAARQLLIRYAEQMRNEFEEDPSPQVAEATARLRNGSSQQ
ncbi:MAG: hypothetical protein H0U04_08355, partial [Rubrobacter sp.]|nr:hypothetical protein [Rubrobacter sp.]